MHVTARPSAWAPGRSGGGDVGVHGGDEVGAQRAGLDPAHQFDRPLREDVWARWLEVDPVRMAGRYGEALRSMRGIYLDAGRSDEYFLDLGAQAFAAELDALDVPYQLELFDAWYADWCKLPGAAPDQRA